MEVPLVTGHLSNARRQALLDARPDAWHCGHRPTDHDRTSCGLGELKQQALGRRGGGNFPSLVSGRGALNAHGSNHYMHRFRMNLPSWGGHMRKGAGAVAVSAPARACSRGETT
jgi:hypothetical protein